jgi:hypothetical protein
VVGDALLSWSRVDRSSSYIFYDARPDATPEAEISALASVYKLCLDKKEAAPRQSRPDEVKGSRNDSPRKVSIP